MKLVILGTGNAGVIECYNTCFALCEEGKTLLVDGGGGNQILYRLKEAKIDLHTITDVFVSHEHIDHLLGIIWIIRVLGQEINKNKYDGNLKIYCHEQLYEKIMKICELTLQQKVCNLFGDRIQFITVCDNERKKILNHETVFFDIDSKKAKQFGFTMEYEKGKKLTFLGDEPYNEGNYDCVKNTQWLLHEAFCLDSEAEIFKPHAKMHGTVKDACITAQKLGVPNLILYHTEDTHLKDREELYRKEGELHYKGNLFVPKDLDEFQL